MGCDCAEKCTIRDAWKREIATIEIAEGDAITDDSQETWNLLQAGDGTTVELIYTVGGFRAGGFRDIPTVVDGVLRGQLGRLKAHVETGRAD